MGPSPLYLMTTTTYIYDLNQRMKQNLPLRFDDGSMINDEQAFYSWRHADALGEATYVGIILAIETIQRITKRKVSFKRLRLGQTLLAVFIATVIPSICCVHGAILQQFAQDLSYLNTAMCHFFVYSLQYQCNSLTLSLNGYIIGMVQWQRRLFWIYILCVLYF